MRRCTRRWKHRHPYRVPRLMHPTEHPQAPFRERNVFWVCVGAVALVSLGHLCKHRRDRLAGLHLQSLLVVLYGNSRNRLGGHPRVCTCMIYVTSKEKRSPALPYTSIVRRSRSRSKQPFVHVYCSTTRTASLASTTYQTYSTLPRLTGRRALCRVRDSLADFKPNWQTVDNWNCL